MKQLLSIVTGVALLSLSVFLLHGGGEEGAQHTRPDVQAPALARALPRGGTSIRSGDYVPAADALPPSLQDEKVTFDRGPKRPGEHPTHYERRVALAAQLDAFVAQARPTERQMRTLLLALYDYQEQCLILDEDWAEGTTELSFADEEAFEALVQDRSIVDLQMEQWDILQARISQTLDVYQTRIWSDVCRRCDIYLTLPHGEPILRLAGEL